MSSEIDKRETQFTIASKSDKAEPTAEEILLGAARRIDLHENMAREMKSRGIVPKGMREAGGHQDYLTGYDMVTAITQNVINAQFRKLWADDVIHQHLDINMKSGMRLVADTNAPTVSLEVAGSHNRVIFMLPLDSGSFTHWTFDDEGPKLISTPIDKWILAFEVNMGMEQIRQEYLREGNGKKTIPSEVLKSLEDFSEDHFNISHLFLDFENADLANFDSVRTVMPKDMSVTDAQQLKNLLGSYVDKLKGTDNPYICGYSVSTKDPSQTAEMMPIFRPTYCTYSTHLHQAKPPATHPITGIDTLNFLLMTEGRQGPTDPQAGIFNVNWVDSEDIQGTMVVSRALFERNYVEILVLPNIQRYLGVPSNFSKSGDGWTLNNEKVDYITHPNADSGMKDIYEENTTRVECSASITRSTSPSITVNGRFFKRKYLYEDWGFLGRTEAWANVILDWRLIIRIIAGSDGKINTPVEMTKISGPNIDKHVDVLFTWGGNIEDVTNDAATYYSALGNSNFLNMKNAFENAFRSLQQLTVFPAGEILFYKDLQVNDEGDLLLHITYKD